MERYYLKKEQRVFMVEQYFKNNEGFSKIIFGDEIHFHDGLVIGRNCRIGGSENPRVIVEK